MKLVAQLLSAAALLGTVVPAIAYLAGNMSLDAVKGWMLAATILWFATVPLWMGRKS